VPCADASFDAVFANTVLLWLRDPLAALKEFRRVLRSGGVAGIRDPAPPPTWGPATPLREEARVLVARATEHSAGRPPSALAFPQRRLLREARFARTEGYVEALSWGTPEVARTEGASWATLLDEAYRPTVLANGWADAAKVDAIVAELRAWGEQPDAFGGALFCAAVGWAAA
jgi:SAM-dependent methyltransferase